jgi:hypothetical protein
MTVFVVERFEMVHVHHQDAERLFIELVFLVHLLQKRQKAFAAVAISEKVFRGVEQF